MDHYMPFLPLTGLTIRAPRSRLTGRHANASLFGANASGIMPGEDDTVAQTRARSGQGTDLELELLPRLCSWGTACGSARTVASSVLSPLSHMGSLRARSLWRPMALRSSGSNSNDFMRSQANDSTTSPFFVLPSPLGVRHLRTSFTMSAAASLPGPLGTALSGCQLFTTAPSLHRLPSDVSPFTRMSSMGPETNSGPMPNPFSSHSIMPFGDLSPPAAPQPSVFGKHTVASVTGTGYNSQWPHLQLSCLTNDAQPAPPPIFSAPSAPPGLAIPNSPPAPVWPVPAAATAVCYTGAIAAAACHTHMPPSTADATCHLRARSLQDIASVGDLCALDDEVTHSSSPGSMTSHGLELFLDSGPITLMPAEEKAIESAGPVLRACASEPHWVGCSGEQADGVLTPAWSTACDGGGERDELELVQALRMSWLDWNQHPAEASAPMADEAGA